MSPQRRAAAFDLYIYGAARDPAVEAYITQEWGV